MPLVGWWVDPENLKILEHTCNLIVCGLLRLWWCFVCNGGSMQLAGWWFDPELENIRVHVILRAGIL